MTKRRKVTIEAMNLILIWLCAITQSLWFQSKLMIWVGGLSAAVAIRDTIKFLNDKKSKPAGESR